MILAIDIGNTRSKIGLYENGEMQDFWNLASKELASELSVILPKIPAKSQLKVGWISVAARISLSRFPMWGYFHAAPIFTHIHSQMNLPIVNEYTTPLPP